MFRSKSSITFLKLRSHVEQTWRCTWPCWTLRSLSCRKMQRNYVKNYMMVRDGFALLKQSNQLDMWTDPSVRLYFFPSLLFCVSVCHKLELERQQHNQLKHTWQRANDQFLESQRLLMRDMQRIESVLSSEQLRQVEEMKKKDQVLIHTPLSQCHTHTHFLAYIFTFAYICVWMDFSDYWQVNRLELNQH